MRLLVEKEPLFEHEQGVYRLWLHEGCKLYILEQRHGGSGDLHRIDYTPRIYRLQ